MTNLFPLPYWAPALQRVPKPLQRLDEAFTLGERARKGGPRHDRNATHSSSPGSTRRSLPLARPLAER
jgi:hypothetical protein